MVFLFSFFLFFFWFPLVDESLWLGEISNSNREILAKDTDPMTNWIWNSFMHYLSTYFIKRTPKKKKRKMAQKKPFFSQKIIFEIRTKCQNINILWAFYFKENCITVLHRINTKITTIQILFLSFLILRPLLWPSYTGQSDKSPVHLICPFL